MMNETLLSQSLAEHLTCTFSRSSGPGGQNVNKVNSRVQASIPIAALQGLSDSELALLKTRLASRIDTQDNLSVSVDTERSQLQNRDLAFQRIRALIIASSQVPKKRVPTKASKASKLRRLQSKKLHSSLKTCRSWAPESE